MGGDEACTTNPMSSAERTDLGRPPPRSGEDAHSCRRMFWAGNYDGLGDADRGVPSGISSRILASGLPGRSPTAGLAQPAHEPHPLPVSSTGSQMPRWR
jgi:hypothetical protein